MTVTRRRVLSGVMWTAAQRWMVRLSSFVVFVVLARQLEPKEFGLVALASVFVGLLNVFSDFGLAMFVVQARHIDQRLTSTVFWCSLGLSTAIAGALAAASPLIALALSEPQLTPVLIVMSLSIVITAFSSIATALLKRQLEFRAIAIRSVLATVVSGALAVMLAIGGAGVWALVAQAISFNCISAVVLWLAGRWAPSFAFDKRVAKEGMKYGSSVLGVQLVGQLRQRGDSFVIGIVAGTVALGYWTVASRIISVVFDTLVQVISSVSTPTFARLKDDPQRLQYGYVSAVTLSLALITPVLAVIAAAAPYAVEVGFGETWERSGDLAQVLCIGTVFSTMVYFDRGLMLAIGRQGTELVVSTVAVALGLVLVAVVAPWGLMAIAIASVVRAVLLWPVRVRVSSLALKFPALPLVRQQILTVAAGGLAAGVALLVVNEILAEAGATTKLVAAVVSVVVVYPAALRVMNREVFSSLMSITRPRRNASETATART